MKEKKTEKSDKREIRPGDIVYFYKDRQTNSGTVLDELSAVITRLADPVSNFREADMAVDLKVFLPTNGFMDRYGAMYSEKPMANRWRWRD